MPEGLLATITVALTLIVAQKLKTQTGNVGILDQNGFNFTVLKSSKSSKDPLPLSIKVAGYCFGQNLNIILNKITGNISLVRSQAWNASGANITQPPSYRTVFIFFFLTIIW